MSNHVRAIYFAVGVLTVFAYVTMYRYMIYWPDYMITVSNLTLNYVVMSFALGALTGWYMWNKALATRGIALRFVGTVGMSFMIVVLWLVIMVTIGGFQLRPL